jgi:hypothetical protein
VTTLLIQTLGLMNKNLISIGLAFALCACAHTTEPVAEPKSPALLLSSVDTSDGVSRAEAVSIAEAYFLKHVGCGAYRDISETSDAWVVEGLFGYAAQPIKGFLINKRSGAITSPVGPSYAHPSDMLQ